MNFKSTSNVIQLDFLLNFTRIPIASAWISDGSPMDSNACMSRQMSNGFQTASGWISIEKQIRFQWLARYLKWTSNGFPVDF